MSHHLADALYRNTVVQTNQCCEGMSALIVGKVAFQAALFGNHFQATVEVSGNWHIKQLTVFSFSAILFNDAQGDISAVVMHYGVFIQNVFDFLIVAFAIFMAIKLINKLNRKKEEPAAAPAPTKEEVLLTEIRDLLKEQNNRS
jgi:large conductance mechanosensitive channel